jgi:serine/threonine protein kinase
MLKSGAIVIGETLGSYVIEQPLGAGGMGQVFLGVHRRIGRRVAIKLLLPQYSSSPGLLSRFFTEARATSLIDHPGIVQIHDCDVHPSGRAYIIMEYLHGESLRSAIGRVGRFSADLPAVANIVSQVAEAVGAAHEKGIVHRDLKPDNFFLLASNDRVPVKVLDFGVAKLLGGESEVSATRTGSLLGTPLYMSPEQCRSAGAVDHRSDIYSLGCIGFEMIVGRPPFEGRGVTDLLIAHASQTPPTPASLGVDVPEPLERLLMQMLAKEPSDRPQTMGEVASSLRAMVDYLPPAIYPFKAQAPSPTGAMSRTAILPATPSPVLSPPPAAYTQAQVFGQTNVPPSYHSRRSMVPNTTFEQSTGSFEAPMRQVLPPRRTGLIVGAALAVVIVGVGLALFWDQITGRPIQHGDVVDEDSNPNRQYGGVRPPVDNVPPLSAIIDIEVDGAPAGLEVTVDGRPARVPLRMNRDNAAHRLVFSAPGYEPETQIIEASSSRIVNLSMKAIKEPDRPVEPRHTTSRPLGGRPSNITHGPLAPPPRTSQQAVPTARPPQINTNRKNEVIIDL